LEPGVRFISLADERIPPVTRKAGIRRQRQPDISFEASEDPEVLDWWSLTPAQRFQQFEELFNTYLALGGSLEPEPDSQSPFYFGETPRPARRRIRRPKKES
jgi:hypothetical protein